MALHILKNLKKLIFGSAEIKKQNKQLSKDLEKLKQLDKDQLKMKIRSKINKKIFLLFVVMFHSLGWVAQNNFITTWKTDNPGASGDKQITIPTFPEETYNYSVDWGDGKSNSGITEGITHNYVDAGTYTITISGVFPRIYFGGANTDKEKILTIEQWGDNQWSSMDSAFFGCKNLNITNANIDEPNLTVATSLRNMFRECDNFNGDITQWNIKSIESLRLMFYDAKAFNQDLSSWNTKNVSDMGAMFSGASNFNQDLGSWDITSLTDANLMFFNNGLSTDNYDATLMGWALDSSGVAGDGIDDIPSDINFNGGTSTFCRAQLFREKLDTTFNWEFSDGNEETNCNSEFITTWKTDNTGITNNNQITIPTFSGETYNYAVDWGDGSKSIGITGNVVHTYSSAGTYTVKITGLFPRIYFHGSNNDRNKILTVQQWGNNKWSSMVFAFSFCQNLNITNANIDSPDLSSTNNLTGMFNHCYNFNYNISNWDVSSIQFMQVMFRESRKFNQDLSAWDVSNVTNMVSMFEGADDFDQSLGNWDISSLTNATDMFVTAGLSTINYDLTLLGWATDSSNVPNDGIDDVSSNVTFSGGNSTFCTEDARENLEDNYNWTITDANQSNECKNGFITTWKTDNSGTSNSNQITIPTLSGQAYSYTVYWGDGNFNENVTGGITHNYNTVGTYTVTITGQFPSIYFNNGGDKDKILTIEQWGNIAWTNMNNSFYGCSNLNITNPSVGTPDLSNVNSSFNTFRNCFSFTGNYMSSWNVSTITNMDYMFSNAYVFNGDIGGWDVSEVTTMFQLFTAAKVFNQDIGNWNVSKVENMRNMFANTVKFNQNISEWNTSKVRNMDGMFVNAEFFDQNIGNWNLSAVTSMTDMLTDSGLSILNYDSTLQGWATDTSNVNGDGIDDIPTGISLNSNGLMYCGAENVRNILQNNYNWTFINDELDETCFVSTWKTDNNGESNDNQITIPTFNGETYNYTVHWGDGTESTGVTGDITHSYQTAGTYTIVITGLFPRIYFHEGLKDREKILTIEQWGTNPWSSMVFAFSFCKNLNITNSNINTPNLSQATNLLAMFNHCYNFNGQIGDWDVGTITNMNSMFRKASAFNQDLSNWDTSKVTIMVNMFEGAVSFDQVLGTWDLSSLTTAENMFLDAGMSTPNYDSTLFGWATDSSNNSNDEIDDVPSSITFSGGNSQYCSAEPHNILSDTYDWNITDGGPGTDCGNAFITTWKTDNIGTSNANQITIPILSSETYNYTVYWGDGKVDYNVTDAITHTYNQADTYTVFIYGQFPSIYFNNSGDKDKIVTIEQWGNIAWTTMNRAFYGCSNLNITNPSVGSPNLSNVDSAYDMFRNCASFTGNYMTNWNVSTITNMDYMFLHASVFNGDIGGWDVSEVTTMFGMFQSASEFNQDIGDWVVSKVENMRAMFNSAQKFNQDISEWNISNVKTTRDMFKNASAFNQDLGKWDLSSVTDLNNMLFNTGLSIFNYDNTLTGWSVDTSGVDADGIDDIPTGIIFNSGNHTYCGSENARNILKSNYDWTISDNGVDESCFVTTWKTDNIGESNNNQITIPTYPGETYNYTVYWGDGTESTGVTGDITHTYANTGTYSVVITGVFPRIYFHEGLKDRNKILTIEHWGNNPWSSMVFAFSFCQNLNITNANIDSPNLSQATNLLAMFNHCYNFNGQIGDWDVGTITNMNSMFREAKVFNQDLSNWDTSKVTIMVNMFEGAVSFDQSLGNWDLTSLNTAENMFLNAGISTSKYDSTIRGWAIDISGTDEDEIDDIPTEVIFNAGNSKFCTSKDDRTNLKNNYDWEISDGNLSNGCTENAFITAWKTDNAGTSNNNQITIPTFDSETYNYTIFWGDGTKDENVTASITHTYANAGTYSVKITGVFPRIRFAGFGDKDKILSIEQWGNIQWSSMSFAFRGCSNLSINANDAPDLSQATRIDYMFDGCSSLNADVSHWDVSTINDMRAIFANCINFNQNLESWDISNVQHMNSMLNYTNLSTKNYDDTLIGWVTDTSGNASDGIDDIPTGVSLGANTLNFCDSEDHRESLITNYNWNFTGDEVDATCSTLFITTWKTDNEGDSNDNQITIPTFNGETYNYTVFWGDGTKTENVTGNITHTYSEAGEYTVAIDGLFPQIYFLSSGDKSKILTIEQWGDNQWKSMNGAFTGCPNLNITNTTIDKPDLSNVTDLQAMLYGCESFNADISGWDVSTITNMNGLFADCTEFNIDISTWNVSNVQYFDGMFENAESFDQNLGNWDISSATLLNNIFNKTALSQQNYDALLTGWATDSSGIAGDGTDDVPSGITFDGGNSEYCNAKLDWIKLDTTYDWTISDGGQSSDCVDPNCTIWNGTNSTSWNVVENWSNGIPTSTLNAIIPDVINKPIIGASVAAQLNDLTIIENGSLTVEDGGSLIVSGNSIGEVTYNKNLNYVEGNSNGWYLLTSPVANEVFNNSFFTTNIVASGSGNNLGVASYDTESRVWSYVQSGTSVDVISGKGYSVKKGISSGNIAFKGNINTSDITSPIVTSGNGYNLMGNPYTSYINTATFLTANTANLDSETIWLWNQNTRNYETKLSGIDADFKLAPGQGFFIKATFGNNVVFSESNQTDNIVANQKTSNSRTEVHLKLSNQKVIRFTKIYFVEGATDGFDNGYDGEVFDLQKNILDIFTQLVSDNIGKNYQVQSLSNANMENVVIPVGIKSDAGLIKISAETINLPSENKVYLEDRLTNTYLNLDNPSTEYEINLEKSINGVGRFYLHIIQSSLHTNNLGIKNKLSAYVTLNNTLKITNVETDVIQVNIYDLTGKEIVNTRLNNKTNYDISLSNLSKGVYIVNIKDEQQVLQKKIILK